MKPNVFVTRKIPGAGLDILQQRCDLEVWPNELPPPYATIQKKAESSDGLLCMLTDKIDKPLIFAAKKKLRVISNYAVGYDNIDIESATEARIPVGNTPGVLTETTADLAFSLLMAAARRIVEGADYARQGKWQTWDPTMLLGQDIHGSTLGILGMGRIGRAVQKRATGFGMRVIYSSSSNKDDIKGAVRVNIETLFKESDFLSLHVPLTEKTVNLVNKETLDIMKPTAVLINTARGGVVDLDALYDALKFKKIGYAALDVTDPEPLPGEHKLYKLPNCLIVPHLGSASVNTRDKMAQMAANNLLAGLFGERLPHCVNPDVYSPE